MITIYCALYPEAQELIRAFELKKETAQRHFQVFSSEKALVRVVLTGAGSVAAASAVAELSTCYPPRKTDFLINFGSCAAGAAFAAGQIFLCNKITEACSGRTFYPDVLYRHPFAEAALFSVAKVMSREEMQTRDALCDMEAAAIYQAGNYYYSPHQMIFLKVVTDHGVAAQETADAQALAHLLREAAVQIGPFLAQLREVEDAALVSEAAQRRQRAQAETDAQKLAEELHCSVTMTAELSQLLFYSRLTGKDYAGQLARYRSDGRLPAKDKREGKRLLEELKANLL